ncbi:MAG TPA: histidinol-phosphate transaminase [Puia sp.]|nr:histidinol-phosphate transaminase [Puia sp.]
MFSIDTLVRDNIRNMVPYSSARDEFKGEAKIFLDANENSLGSSSSPPYNRYPDPLQDELKHALSQIKGIPSEHIFFGNGSDECIDLLYRAFCRPGKDNVIICPPTYGMYEVCARINDIAVRRAQLRGDFQLDLQQIEKLIDENTKIIWICSPNNPTGNAMARRDIEIVLNNFEGLVVIDEAYVNFSKHKSFTLELGEYPNLIILQTLSKAWGLAGLRLGMAFASKEIILLYNKIKPPYNISEASQQMGLEALKNINYVNEMTREIVELREQLLSRLKRIQVVLEVFPSETNFLLVKFADPLTVYSSLLTKGIVVRDRSNFVLCERCLRVTVGTASQNNELITALSQIST